MAFNGKVALITGGGSGMGQCAARILAEGGASVAILDVNEEGMAETAQGHAGVHPFKVDISDTEAVHAVVAQVERDRGRYDRRDHSVCPDERMGIRRGDSLTHSAHGTDSREV